MLRRSYFRLSSDKSAPPPRFHPLLLFGDVACPFTHRCTIVAAHKRVPLEIYEVSNRDKPAWWNDFFISSSSSKTSRARLLAESGSATTSKRHQQKIKALEFSAPILQVGSHFIRDSKVISEYLDSTYPPTNSLLPPMPHIRAHVRQFQSACADLIDAMYDFLHFVPVATTSTTTITNTNKAPLLSPPGTHQQPDDSSKRQLHPGVIAHHSNIVEDEAEKTLHPHHQSIATSSPSNNNIFAATTTNEGRARGRKKSVLAAQILDHQLALPKTCAAGNLDENGDSLFFSVTEESLLRDLRFQLRRVEAFLDHSASPFLLGAGPSLGDMTLIPFIDRFRYVFAAYKNFYLLEEAPALGRLMQAAEMLSSFQRTRLNAQEYLEAFDYLLDNHQKEIIPPGGGEALLLPSLSPTKKISRRLEIFTPQHLACPWTDTVRLIAALKNIEYSERPIQEFASYERNLKDRLKRSKKHALEMNTSATAQPSTNHPWLSMENDNNEDLLQSEQQTQSEDDEQSQKTKGNAASHSATATTMTTSTITATSLLENATGENVIVRPSSGLHPIKSALCACQYLVDAYSSALVIPRHSAATSTLSSPLDSSSSLLDHHHHQHPTKRVVLKDSEDEMMGSFSSSGATSLFRNPDNNNTDKKDDAAAAKIYDNKYKNQSLTVDDDDISKLREGDTLPAEMMIDLEIESHLDAAHQHYLLNYMEKHFGPRVVTYLHAKSEFEKVSDSNHQNKASIDKEKRVLNSCEDRLRESIGIIANEIRAKPYSVCSTLCLADVVICAFFAKIDLNEVMVVNNKSNNNNNQNNNNSADTNNDEIEMENLFDAAALVKLKGCLYTIRQTVRSGLNQSVKLSNDDETKKKLIELRRRIFDEQADKSF